MKRLALPSFIIALLTSAVISVNSQVGAPLTPGTFSNQNGNGSSTGNQTINGNLTVNGTETITVPSGSTGLTINGNQDSVFHTYVGANNNNGTGAYADFRLTAGTGLGNTRNAYVGVSSPNVAAGAAGGSRAWLDTGANSSTGWDYISALSGGNHRFYTDGYAAGNLRTTIDSTGITIGGSGLLRVPSGQGIEFGASVDTAIYGSSGSDTISFYTASAEKAKLVGNVLSPSTSAGSDLGNVTNKWGNVWTQILSYASLAVSSTAPTATTFCSSPSVPASNGTAAFTINVGTTCVTSVGTITFPAATTSWVVNCFNVTAPATNVIGQTGGTTTTVTITNYARTTGIASNWTDSNILRCQATGY